MSENVPPVPPTADAPEPELWKPLAFESDGPPKYVHELPKPEGDPWQNILDPLQKRDRERCDGWKDEVQNLLIFAGLFSAVVTAFLIESYQTLQPDPQVTVVGILTHIAARLDAFNQTLSPSSLPPLALASTTFAPSPSSIRVNILWFISLIFSLTVVLAGIVCMQWLREHQAYASVSSPRDIFPLFRMRQVALERWRVPVLFATLPLLLEVSLVLFFVGVADFLWGIQQTVAAFVIVAISVPIVFLFLTTILPTLQFFTLYKPQCQINSFVPAPCPYKSPQSRIFLQAISRLDIIFQTLSWLFAALYIPLFKALFSLFNSGPLSNKDCQRLSEYLPEAVLECIRSESWTELDECFLRYRAAFDRTIFLQHAHNDIPYEETPYDVVRGLVSIVLQENDESVLLSAYNNLQEMSLMERRPYRDLAIVDYFEKLSKREDEQAVTRPEWQDVDATVLQGAWHEWHLCSLFVHSNIHAAVRPSRIPNIQLHAEELNTRLVTHLFSFMTKFGNDATYRRLLDDYYLTDRDTAIIPSHLLPFKGPELTSQRIQQFRFLCSEISSFNSSQKLANDFDYSLFRDFGSLAVAALRTQPSDSEASQSLVLALLGDISDNLTIPDGDSVSASVTWENKEKDFFFWASSNFLDRLVLRCRTDLSSEKKRLLRRQPVFDNWLKYHNYIVKTWDHNWRRDRPELARIYHRFTEELMPFIAGKGETVEAQEQNHGTDRESEEQNHGTSEGSEEE